MTDTWNLERAWREFCEAIPDENWSDNLEKAAAKVESEIADLESWDGEAWQYTQDILDKIRLGVYDEGLHGSLKDVLETIERRLGE